MVNRRKNDKLLHIGYTTLTNTALETNNNVVLQNSECKKINNCIYLFCINN